MKRILVTAIAFAICGPALAGGYQWNRTFPGQSVQSQQQYQGRPPQETYQPRATPQNYSYQQPPVYQRSFPGQSVESQIQYGGRPAQQTYQNNGGGYHGPGVYGR